MGEKQKYFTLLTKLVKTKMQLDIEDSIEDDFDDLRKDFKNVVNNDVVKKLNILEKKNGELTSVVKKLDILEKKNEELTKSNSIILAKLEEILLKFPDKSSESNA